MKHFASQEDTVTMIHTYLQILQQYNIDLNLSYLREMPSSPMEDYSNLLSHFHAPLCYFHHTHYTESTLFLLMSTSSFNPSALPTSPAVPPHLVLLSSLAPTPLTPALADRWWSVLQKTMSSCFFFSSKSKQNPRKLVLPLSYSKANKTPTPPTKSNHASSKHPLLHLKVAATCGMSGVGRCVALFFSLLQLLRPQHPWGGIMGIKHHNGLCLLWTNMSYSLIMDHEVNTFPLGVVKVEEVSGFALPSL